MTRAQVRELLLSFDGVEERPHMDRVAFRTKRKIFATLGEGTRLHVKIAATEQRDELLASFPKVFFSLGGWTRLGYVAIDVAKIDPALLRDIVVDAWRDALPKTKAPRRREAKVDDAARARPSRGRRAR